MSGSLVALSPRIVAAVALIVFLVLLVVLVILIRRRRAAATGVPEGVEDMPGKVRQVFASAQAALHTRASDRAKALLAGPTQAAPGTGRRVLVIGPAGAGKTTLIRQLARDVTFAPAAASTPGSPLNLFRIDGAQSEGALAVDVAGRVIRDADGKGRGGEAFKAMLAELSRAFPERPVDSIVLAVPIGMLGPETARDTITEEAARTRRRVEEALETLAMNVPVYLVVTQCDALPSFMALGQEVGESRLQRVLGWSRPERETDDPATDWVDEALRSVGAALTDEQERRFAADQPVAYASDYFLVPADLAARGDALRAFVDPIFHDRASGPPLDLRGIYFSGRAAPAPPTDPAAAAAPPPILFVGELFTRKILPECNLGQPSAVAEHRRRLTIGGLVGLSAAILLVWGLVLLFKMGSLARQTESVLPYLEHLNSDFVHLTAGDRRTAKYAVGLLDMLAGVNTNRLRTWAVPFSLLSPVDSRLEDAFALGYDRIILAAFRQTIDEAGAVRPDPPPDVDASEIATAALDQTPEFGRADDWLRRIEAYSADVERYNQIVQAHDKHAASEREIQAIADLSESLFRHKVNQSFFGNAKHYTSALDLPIVTAERLDLRAMAPDAQRDAQAVFDDLHRRLYVLNSGPVVPDDLEELLASFRELEDPSRDYTTKQLRRLQRAIKNMEDHVGREALKWVPGDQVPPAPPKQEALYKRVEALRVLLGPDVAARLRQDAKDRLLRLQGALRGAKDPLLGPVLSRKQGGERLEMKLAAEILSLSEPIDIIARQPYMAGGEERTGVREVPVEIQLPPDTRAEWDVDALKSTAKVIKDYGGMLADGPFSKFPRPVQGRVRELAERRVQVWLHALFNNNRVVRKADASAGGLVPYHVLFADAQNFGLAGAPLREIIAELGRAHVDESRDQVRVAVRGQGARVLRALNRTLGAENLYHASFSFWNGDGTPVFRAFQVTDAAQLAEHLVDQRTRAEKLEREISAPVLTSMLSPELGAQDVADVARWDRIAAALRDYEAKKAGNSVTALERFILTDLPAVTDLDKCLALDKTTARGRDFFGARRRQIYDALRERCLAVGSDDMRDWYERLRLEYNRSLADRFPFSKNERAEDAAPEAVRSFVVGASDFRKRYRGVLAERRDSSSKEMVRFLDRIEGVRSFLSPLWASGDLADGAFEVRVEFRTNTSRELAGNEIAGWTMRLAEDRLTRDGPKSSARWHIDDPVRVELRWAKNSPDMPSSSQAPRVVVSDRTVIFEERGLWGLLRLIAAHRSTLRDSESRAQGSSLLVFNVRTIPDPQGGFIDRVGVESSSARVFIRLTLTSTAKDKAVVLRYPDFPTRAPVYFDTPK